jgi:effector-binding domain-containing protein
MMATEEQGAGVEALDLDAQPVASIRGTVRIADLGQAMDDRITALSGYLRRHGARAAGPPFVRYHTFGETETDMEFGVPVGESVAGEGRVAAGELPGGPAVATWHIGPHDRLGEAYARIDAWLKEHGREPAGPAWEVYYWLDPSQHHGPASMPDPASWRTQLIQPIKETASR